MKFGEVICEESIVAYRAKLMDRELSQNTINSYITAVKQYKEAHTRVSKEDMLSWKRELMDTGKKPGTVNLRLAAMNTWCRMFDIREAEVRTLKIHQASAIDNVITQEDYAKLCKHLNDDNPRWYFNIRLLASTGARVSEYIKLTKADFDRGYAEMWTKGKIRRIYIPKSFITEAQGYYKNLQPHEMLVQSIHGKPITTRGVSENLLRFAEKYGIDKRVMHPHSFRHLFALNFLSKNNNLSLLADIMGHSSVSTTAIYTRMTKQQQATAVDEIVNW